MRNRVQRLGRQRQHDGEQPADAERRGTVDRSGAVAQLRAAGRSWQEMHPEQQAVEKNSACSTSCTRPSRSVRSYNTGQMPREQRPVEDARTPAAASRARGGAPEPARASSRSALLAPACDGPERQRARHPGPRPAEQKQRRRHHHQQHVLDHVHPEQRVGVGVDRRVDREDERREPAVEGSTAPTLGAAAPVALRRPPSR